MTFRLLLLLGILLLWHLTADGQENDTTIRLKVLNSALIDSTFIFGHWDEKSETETHLKYLGKVETEKGQILKIMTSVWYWGASKEQHQEYYCLMQTIYIGVNTM